MSITYMKNLQLIDDRVNNLMRTLIVIFIVVLFAYLVSCGGGDGNGGEEFTVFDVTVRVLEVESQNGPTDCPESANLKLSLLINGNSLSGFAELIEFGNIGDPRDVLGLLDDSSFSLEPFTVSVNTDPFCSPENPDSCFFGSFILDFALFEGNFLNNEQEMTRLEIEGIVSGDITFGETDAITCHAEFTGEFSGKEKIPNGCVSAAELTLDKSRDCPAEAISNLCNGVYYACDIPESNPPPGLFQLDNRYDSIDCITLGNPSAFITDLELGISGSIIGGNFIGTGEPLICRWLHSGL